jgi:hypothetical protein
MAEQPRTDAVCSIRLQNFLAPQRPHSLGSQEAALSGSSEYPPGGGNSANARLIAAQAKSLSGTLLRDRPRDLPISADELADAVELIELLATALANDLQARRHDA